jgi:hypothetical protein
VFSIDTKSCLMRQHFFLTRFIQKNNETMANHIKTLGKLDTLSQDAGISSILILQNFTLQGYRKKHFSAQPFTMTDASAY